MGSAGQQLPARGALASLLPRFLEPLVLTGLGLILPEPQSPVLAEDIRSYCPTGLSGLSGTKAWVKCR